jgi:hypothetical protein
MSQAEIRIDLSEERLRRSGTGLALGDIWLSVDGSAFPSARWSDFIVVVLGWWCQALLELLRGDPEPRRVHFMDGPFHVELGPLVHGSLHLVLVERDLQKQEVDVEPNPLVSSVLSAAAQVLHECRRRDWWSSDEDALARAKEELRRAAIRVLE